MEQPFVFTKFILYSKDFTQLGVKDNGPSFSVTMLTSNFLTTAFPTAIAISEVIGPPQSRTDLMYTFTWLSSKRPHFAEGIIVTSGSDSPHALFFVHFSLYFVTQLQTVLLFRLFFGSLLL